MEKNRWFVCQHSIKTPLIYCGELADTPNFRQPTHSNMHHRLIRQIKIGGYAQWSWYIHVTFDLSKDSLIVINLYT